VDPGGEIERILAAVGEEDIALEKILLTHAHIDHAGGAADLAERCSLPVEGPHEGDRFWIEQLEEQSRMFGFPPARAFEPDRWLADGDVVTVGDTRLDVLHCPGHTPGHVVFVQMDERIAIVGDVLFKGSIGRSDFPGSDHDALLRSIREKLFPLGDDITFVPGHGPASTFGAERASNPFVRDAARC
jgi:glyoxylase-like metal-dependent hydrolase (beta-lactamase superfamily II)